MKADILALAERVLELRQGIDRLANHVWDSSDQPLNRSTVGRSLDKLSDQAQSILSTLLNDLPYQK